MSGAGWLLQNAAVAGLAAGALLALLRVWRPPPVVEHLLWLAITVKLILPPVTAIPVPGGSPEILQRTGLVWPVVPERVGRDPGGPAEGEAMAAAPDARDGAARPSDAAFTSEVDGTRDETAAPPWMRWLSVLWVGGALVVAVRLLTGHLRFRRRLQRSGEASAGLRGLVEGVARDLGIHPPRIVVSARVPTPVVVGLTRPSLVWPAELRLPEQRARTVVAHELAHLRRRDLWSGLLEWVADAVWWWWPGWWIVRRRARHAAERACDAIVVGLYPEQRRAYAEALLDVLSQAGRRRLASGLGVDGAGPVRVRLERILEGDAGSGGGRVAYGAVTVAALVLLPTWSQGPVRPASGEPPPAPAPADRGMAGIASRGVVRFGDAGGVPEVEPGGWLVAFEEAGAASPRRFEVLRDEDEPARVRYRIEGRAVPVDAEAAAWLRAVVQRTGYEPEATRAGLPATAAWVPSGPHAHRTDGSEVLAVWSPVSRPIEADGALGSALDPGRPLVVVHQAEPNAPVWTLTVAGSPEGVRVADAAVDGTPPDAEAARAHWEATLKGRVAEAMGVDPGTGAQGLP